MSVRMSRLMGFPDAPHLAPELRREIEKTVHQRVTPWGGVFATGIGVLVCNPDGAFRRAWHWLFLGFGITAWWAQMAVQICVSVPVAVVLYNRFYGARLRRAFRDELKSRGLCTRCGYSLTGNVSGVSGVWGGKGGRVMDGYAEYQRRRRVRRFRFRMFVYAVSGVAFFVAAGRVVWADRRHEGAPEWAILTAALSPIYPFAVASASMHLEWQRKRYARRLVGRCWRCGYDLTGNASGVCPECGTEAEAGAAGVGARAGGADG